jgi:hypothetical protein
LDESKGVPEKLLGYEVKDRDRRRIWTRELSIITPEDDSDCIEGIVYELTVEELQLSDTYEGNSYSRIQV